MSMDDHGPFDPITHYPANHWERQRLEDHLDESHGCSGTPWSQLSDFDIFQEHMAQHDVDEEANDELYGEGFE